MGGKPPDPYEVLGLVQADAPSASDVRKAYHRLARVHHPDKARTPEEKDAAETRFKEIGAAYEILSDPEKRDKYDRDGFDDHEWMTPAEAEEEERHARRMYCAAMGIPETVVREVWCDLEELYAGCVRREGVVVHVVAVESGVPEKESKVFSVRVRPGTRDGREVRFGCLGTNALQSVAFVVREQPHPLFTRAPHPSPDVLFWCALTPSQHEKGAVLGVPTLSGRELRLSVKPNSAVAPARGSKVVAGEGFPRADEPGARGDMRVHFRVMTPVEAWVREGNRMWWCKALAFVAGGYGALAASFRSAALGVGRRTGGGGAGQPLARGISGPVRSDRTRDVLPEVSNPSGVGEGVGGHGVRVRGGPARHDRLATKRRLASERNDARKATEELFEDASSERD